MCDPLSKRLYVALAATLLLGGHLAHAQEELPLGSELPLQDRVMWNATGDSMTVAQAAGSEGIAIVTWSLQSCPWVDGYEDRVLKLRATYAEQGVEVAWLNTDKNYSWHEFTLLYSLMYEVAQNAGWEIPYFLDANLELAAALRATRMPQAFLFDDDLQLVYRGVIDDSPGDSSSVQNRYLKDAIDAMLADQEIAVPTTKEFGCLIRYEETSTRVEDEPGLPLHLAPAYPNPFSREAHLRFAVPDARPVRVMLYNALGQEVRVLFEGFAPAGVMQSVRVDGSGLPSGVYLYRLEAGTYTKSKKLVLLK